MSDNINCQNIFLNNLTNLDLLCLKVLELLFLGKLLNKSRKYKLFSNIKCKYRCGRNTLWNLFHILCRPFMFY